jgi:hypothetical protein
MSAPKPYQGHRSWNAWNVSLWLMNEELSYREVIRWRDLRGTPYAVARRVIARGELPDRTPDGARYNVSSVAAVIAAERGEQAVYLADRGILLGAPFGEVEVAPDGPAVTMSCPFTLAADLSAALPGEHVSVEVSRYHPQTVGISLYTYQSGSLQLPALAATLADRGIVLGAPVYRAPDSAASGWAVRRGEVHGVAVEVTTFGEVAPEVGQRQAGVTS